MTVIHPPLHTAAPAPGIKPWTAPTTEIEAVNELVDVQRANGDAIDPAGARRFVRSLVALGLLRFE